MNWQLTFSGLPISDADELREQVEPLLMEAGNVTEILADLTAACAEQRPADWFEDRWMDREPGIVGSIGFILPPSDQQLIAAPVGDNLVRSLEHVALTHMMGAMGNHFLLAEGGAILVNPNDPPSLENAYAALQSVMDTRASVSKLENFSMWSLGALIDQCEAYFGEEFDMTTVMGATGTSYNTAITTVNTYRAFRGRRFRLTFTHHKEVLYSNIAEPQMMAVLGASERLNLSVVEQRKVVSYIRRHGIPDDAPNFDAFGSAEELLERVEIRIDRTKWLFTFEDRLYNHTGSHEAIPRGATNIVNVDRMEFLDGASATEIPKWTMTAEPVDGAVEVVAPAPRRTRRSARQMAADASADDAPPPPRVRRTRRRTAAEAAAETIAAAEPPTPTTVEVPAVEVPEAPDINTDEPAF